VFRYRVTNNRVIDDGGSLSWKAVIVSPDPRDLYEIISTHSTRDAAVAACERDYIAQFGADHMGEKQ